MSPQTWILLITTALLIELAIALNLDSWQVYRAEAQKAEGIKRQLENTQEARLHILKQGALLESPGGMEERARSLGFRKEGEISLPGGAEPQPIP